MNNGKPPVYSGDAKKALDALAPAGAAPLTLAALNALTLTVKDLGPQFSYRGVFLIEYGGPIAIVLAALLRPAAIFGAGSQPLNVLAALTEAGMRAPVGTRAWNEFVQSSAIVLWVAHFAKRELETCGRGRSRDAALPERRRSQPPRLPPPRPSPRSLFVHKFSRSHMPLSNLFKNSIYYWGFAAAVAYPLVHPAFTAPSKAKVAIGAAVWLVSQATNFAVHWQLANMRGAEGDTARAPPGGPLFALVACPNYTAEVAGWVGWSLLSQVAAGYAFTFIGFAQMADWALKKLGGYKKDNAAWARSRKALVPFLL